MLKKKWFFSSSGDLGRSGSQAAAEVTGARLSLPMRHAIQCTCFCPRMHRGGSNAPADPRFRRADVYTIGKELGTGTFGVVRQVEHRDSGDRYALKTINKEKLDEHQMKYLEAECEVLKQVDQHPNIVKMLEIYDTPKKLVRPLPPHARL